MGSAIHRNIPDSRGTNVFEADRSLQNLLRAYLSASVQARVLPQFERMGKLVGDRLEKLALAADRNPPVLGELAHGSIAMLANVFGEKEEL